jgi:hypothetical protein
MTVSHKAFSGVAIRLTWLGAELSDSQFANCKSRINTAYLRDATKTLCSLMFAARQDHLAFSLTLDNPDFFSQFVKIIGRPDIQNFDIGDKRYYILPYLVHGHLVNFLMKYF